MAIGSPKRKLVSIIIPARNEEENIPRVEKEVTSALAGLDYDFEFIIVDNASTDRTRALALDLCARDDRWRYVRFSRDFTVEASMTAGYRLAQGDAMVVLYSDLQDPPEAVTRLLAKWEEGFDVVYGVRTVRPGDARWRNFLVDKVYRTIRRLSDPPIPRNAGDFRLISRRVRDALNECGEYNRYMRGLISWLGFRQAGVEYERRPRLAGKSNAPFWDLVSFTFNAVTSFSLKPLRVFTAAGFVLLGLSVGAIPVYVGLFFAGHPPAGITTVIILLLFAIGLNSLGVGVLGEYLGRTYAETKRRPLYLIEEVVNIGEWNDASPATRGGPPRLSI
ncbi:MAG: glycosyltransferase family 2 protein [Actinomycetota bacterium]